MSLEEIAGVTAAPLSTVKSRLYRGLAALKPAGGTAAPRPKRRGRRAMTPRPYGLRLDSSTRRRLPHSAATARPASLVNRTHRIVRERARTQCRPQATRPQPVDPTRRQRRLLVAHLPPPSGPPSTERSDLPTDIPGRQPADARLPALVPSRLRRPPRRGLVPEPPERRAGRPI